MAPEELRREHHDEASVRVTPSKDLMLSSRRRQAIDISGELVPEAVVLRLGIDVREDLRLEVHREAALGTDHHRVEVSAPLESVAPSRRHDSLGFERLSIIEMRCEHER